MRYKTALFASMIFFIITGCSGIQLPAVVRPVTVSVTQTPSLLPEPTSTLSPLPSFTPTLTPTPNLTLTFTPTVFMTPTATPKNFALAEKGFDIADVRYSYPREDILIVDFKYRIDEQLEG